jgi:hypothetical protein
VAVGVLLLIGGLNAVAVSTLAQETATTPGAAVSPAPAAAPTPLSLQTLSQLQPGLSTYMMETAQRFGIMWFAAQQNNWDLAAFEGREAEQVLQHGAVRSTQTRQLGINGYNTAFLEPLIQAAQSGDQARFTTAYNRAIEGCNACHASQTYGQTNRSFGFIKVQVPTNTPEDVYAYGP